MNEPATTKPYRNYMAWVSSDRTKLYRQVFDLIDKSWSPVGPVETLPFSDDDVEVNVREEHPPRRAQQFPPQKKKRTCQGGKIYTLFKIRWIGIPDPLRERAFRKTPIRYLAYTPFRLLGVLMPPDQKDGTYAGCGCIYKLKTAWALIRRDVKMWWNL